MKRKMLDTTIAFFALISLKAVRVYAGTELTVVEVRRNITLADTDPVYKDFYLNSGTEAGIKKNQILNVYRQINVKDSSGSQVIGEMKIPVGQIKIIAVYGKVSVAREVKLFSREDLPMLEQTGIMVGDKVADKAGE